MLRIINGPFMVVDHKNKVCFLGMDDYKCFLGSDFFDTDSSLPFVCEHEQIRCQAVFEQDFKCSFFEVFEVKVCIICHRCRQVACDSVMSELVLLASDETLVQIASFLGGRSVDLSLEAKKIMLDRLLYVLFIPALKETVNILIADQKAGSEQSQ